MEDGFAEKLVVVCGVTYTVALEDVVPPAPVQLRVYVVVLPGYTAPDPLVVTPVWVLYAPPAM